MPKVLLLTGAGGAGKSTIAELIAKRNGYVYLDGDNEDTEFFPDGNQWLPENTEKLKMAHEKILQKTAELVEKDMQKLDRETAEKILETILDSQQTIDQLSPMVAEVGSSVCKPLSDNDVMRECESMCQSKMENICRNAYENIKKKNPEDMILSRSEFMLYCLKIKLPDDLQQCEYDCKQECLRGNECVCIRGKIDKAKTRELYKAQKELKFAYESLSDESGWVSKALDQNGITIVKRGNTYVVESVIRQVSDTGMFSDVTSSHAYATAIEWAKNNRVLQGYPDGTFKPDRTVNRAEFLKIVLEAKGGDLATSSSTSGFSDVDENSWYALYVRYAKQQGIIQGYPDGSFKPEQAVNFAEAQRCPTSLWESPQRIQGMNGTSVSCVTHRKTMCCTTATRTWGRE